MWAVTSCPKCNKPVAVPMTPGPNVLMRCPLCKAEYPLQEALNNLPPELEVVGTSAPEPIDSAVEPVPEPSFITEEKPRKVRQERSTTRMMLEVLIGGLLAGPIAMFIIMWGFGRDPLKLSEKLPSFMVPPSLRAEAQK